MFTITNYTQQWEVNLMIRLYQKNWNAGTGQTKISYYKYGRPFVRMDTEIQVLAKV